MTERRYDIDWLRNLAILLLFPFHSARVFDIFEPNYVKNALWQPGLTLGGPHAGLSDGLSMFLFYTGYWFMPLLFWLAGSSSWYALRKRSGSRYVRERSSRLLVPLLFGLLFLVPPQGYMAQLAQGYGGGYWNFLLGYFRDFHDLSGYYGSFTPAHLWFILYLFVISPALLPLMLSVRRRAASAGESGRPAGFTGWLARPGVYLLLFIPLAVSEAPPDIGGKNLFFYALLFLLGYLAASDERVQDTINRLRFPALVVLPFCLALYTLMAFAWGFGNYPDISLPQAAMACVRDFALLLTLTAILGYGNKRLNRSAKALPYMNRAAFPVYILHQTALVVVAYFAVRWALPVALKFTLITALSFAATLAIYEVIVRRFGAARVLLGVKQ
jgi:peptidoglycan/LPS O-acetylase OafA/YrhL